MAPFISTIRKVVITVTATLFFAIAGASATITLKITPGLDNGMRPGACLPVMVQISGSEREGPGELQLVVEGQFGTRTYSQPVLLRSSMNSEMHSLGGKIPDFTRNIKVRLVANGRTMVEQDVTKFLPLSREQTCVIALMQEAAGYNNLSRYTLNKHIGALQDYFPQSQNQYSSSPPNTAKTRILYPRSSIMPDNSSAYDMVDLAILGDMPMDTINDSQWGALLNWIKSGGLLVITGGGDINRIRNPQILDILPIIPQAVKQIDNLSSLSKAYSGVPLAGSFPIISGVLRTDAQSLIRQNDILLISSRPLGMGRVIFTAFDPARAEIKSWAGNKQMWEDISSYTHAFSLVDFAQLKNEAVNNTSNYYGGGVDRSIMAVLGGMQVDEAPSFVFVGVFLVLYILCLVPLNYFILKRKGIREMAWFTAPVIILIFSSYAYFVGRSLKGSSLLLHTCSIVEGVANVDGFQTYTLADIFSPGSTSYQIHIKDPSAEADEIALMNAGISSEKTNLNILEDNDVTIRDVNIPMWDHRTFSIRGFCNIGGSFAVSASPAGQGMVHLQISNNTPVNLENAGVMTAAGFHFIGDLNTGQSWTGNVQPPDNTQLNMLSANQTNKNNPVRSALLSQFNVQGSDGSFATPFILMGWAKSSVTEITIAGETPQTRDNTLIAVHLPWSIWPNRNTARYVNSDSTQSGGGGNPAGIIPPRGGTYSPAASQAEQFNRSAYAAANAGNPKEGVRLAEKALKLNPSSGYILDTVGEMHQRLGENTRAIYYYKLALKKIPGDRSETHEKFGEALQAIGKFDEARAQYMLATATNAMPWAQKARDHMRQLPGHNSPNGGD